MFYSKFYSVKLVLLDVDILHRNFTQEKYVKLARKGWASTKFIKSLSRVTCQRVNSTVFLQRKSTLLQSPARTRFVPQSDPLFCILFLKLRGTATTTRIRDQDNFLRGARPLFPWSFYKADRTYELPNTMYSTMKKVLALRTEKEWEKWKIAG